jgi:fatty-acyl-CoA synthase
MSSPDLSTITGRLLRNYDAAPDRAAITLLYAKQPDHALTFKALMQGAAGYAQAYAAAGVMPGEVVVLILQHGEALVYAYWGALLAGVVPSIMPFLTEKLSPEKYRQELAALVEITRPAAVVTYPEFAGEVRTAVNTDGSSVRAVLLSDGLTPVDEPDLAAMPGLKRSPDDLALLQHSSGTTGLQKGVALSHRSVLNQLDRYSDAIRLTAEDTIVSWLPLYHDMGLIAGFVMPVVSQTSLVLMSPFDWVRAPYRLLQAISQHGGTLAWLPNFAYNFCAQKTRDRDLQGVDLSRWRAVINCSEPMRWESHQAFLKRFAPYGFKPEALATCYAMAENVFAVTQGGFDGPVAVDGVDRRALITEQTARPATEADPEFVRLLSAGKPLPNVAVRVLDEQRQDVADRRIGEIALRSDCMLSGYYNRADLTERAFHDGWYLTGDLGYQAGGELYVTGRKKDLIIVGGKNVHPQDLETLASEVPGVHPGRVVAFGVFDDEAGTEDVVVVAEADTENGSAPSEDEQQRLADEIRQRINRGSDVSVRQVHVVGARWILKTSSGKLARAANREKFLAGL